jgi:hypothetical protein
MAKMQMLVELDYDEDLWHSGNNEEEWDWFINHLLKDDLILHSNLVGDFVGSLTLVEVLSDTNALD